MKKLKKKPFQLKIKNKRPAKNDCSRTWRLKGQIRCLMLHEAYESLTFQRTLGEKIQGFSVLCNRFDVSILF